MLKTFLLEMTVITDIRQTKWYFTTQDHFIIKVMPEEFPDIDVYTLTFKDSHQVVYFPDLEGSFLATNSLKAIHTQAEWYYEIKLIYLKSCLDEFQCVRPSDRVWNSTRHLSISCLSTIAE